MEHRHNLNDLVVHIIGFVKGGKKLRKKLTNRQQEILDFIEESINTRGYPPTFREICNQFGMRSPNGARVNLLALEKKGYILKRPKLSRGIELVHFAAVKHAKKGEKTVNYIPLYGNVAAGEPIFANENVLQLMNSLFLQRRFMLSRLKATA